MADPTYAATPQAFTFGQRKLVGQLESFSGRSSRRYALHEFLKRPGARVEDMERAPQRLDVRLVFIGDDCAKQYADFVKFVDENPFGLLVHPSAGKFNAFCEGPSEDVNLGRAVNEISVRCTWVESNVDAEAPPQDIPQAPAAAQQATNQLTAFQQATAKFMGEVAEGKGLGAAAVAQVQDAIANISSVADPIAEIRSVVSTTVGATSAAVGAIVSVQTQAELLSQDVQNFVLSTSDIFDGDDVAAASSDAVDLLLGTVVDRAAETETAMLAAASSAAGAADAVGATAELVASCYVLRDALAQARPPVVNYTVQRTVDLVSLCVQLYPGASATAQASVILGLNRIKNPAAIRAGTVLRVPSR